MVKNVKFATLCSPSGAAEADINRCGAISNTPWSKRSAGHESIRWTSHRLGVLLVPGSSSATCDSTYIRQHTVQVLLLL